MKSYGLPVGAESATTGYHNRYRTSLRNGTSLFLVNRPIYYLFWAK